MGVNGLWRLLRSSGSHIAIDSLGSARLAVDASIWLTQFVKAMRDSQGNLLENAHIMGMFSRIARLLFHRIRPVFVFDGPAPALKRLTLAKRRALRSKAKSDITKAAEKLLLQQMKLTRLKALAQNVPNVDASSTQQDDTGVPKWLDERLAAESSSSPSSELDTSDSENFDIPQGEIDNATLAAMPAKMQLAVVAQKQQELRNSVFRSFGSPSAQQAPRVLRIHPPDQLSSTSQPKNSKTASEPVVPAHDYEVKPMLESDPLQFSQAQLTNFLKASVLNRQARSAREGLVQELHANAPPTDMFSQSSAFDAPGGSRTVAPLLSVAQALPARSNKAPTAASTNVSLSRYAGSAPVLGVKSAESDAQAAKWRCDCCHLLNASGATVCEACGTPQTVPVPASVSPVSPPAPQSRALSFGDSSDEEAADTPAAVPASAPSGFPSEAPGFGANFGTGGFVSAPDPFSSFDSSSSAEAPGMRWVCDICGSSHPDYVAVCSVCKLGKRRDSFGARSSTSASTHSVSRTSYAPAVHDNQSSRGEPQSNFGGSGGSASSSSSSGSGSSSSSSSSTSNNMNINSNSRSSMNSSSNNSSSSSSSSSGRSSSSSGDAAPLSDFAASFYTSTTLSTASLPRDSDPLNVDLTPDFLEQWAPVSDPVVVDDDDDDMPPLSRPGEMPSPVSVSSASRSSSAVSSPASLPPHPSSAPPSVLSTPSSVASSSLSTPSSAGSAPRASNSSSRRSRHPASLMRSPPLATILKAPTQPPVLSPPVVDLRSLDIDLDAADDGSPHSSAHSRAAAGTVAAPGAASGGPQVATSASAASSAAPLASAPAATESAARALSRVPFPSDDIEAAAAERASADQSVSRALSPPVIDGGPPSEARGDAPAHHAPIAHAEALQPPSLAPAQSQHSVELDPELASRGQSPRPPSPQSTSAQSSSSPQRLPSPLTGTSQASPPAATPTNAQSVSSSSMVPARVSSPAGVEGRGAEDSDSGGDAGIALDDDDNDDAEDSEDGEEEAFVRQALSTIAAPRPPSVLGASDDTLSAPPVPAASASATAPRSGSASAQGAPSKFAHLQPYVPSAFIAPPTASSSQAHAQQYIEQEQTMADIAASRRQQQYGRRGAAMVTEEMVADAKELLRLFGIPFVVGAAEAEAQCAILEQLGLVDGVITDDSDVFLFGAKNVFRNLFDRTKHLERYRMADIEKDLGLDRDGLIRLAMMLGSDYTTGVKGIGIVNAMEVVHAFPGDEGLIEFQKWLFSNERVETEPEEPVRPAPTDVSLTVSNSSAGAAVVIDVEAEDAAQEAEYEQRMAEYRRALAQYRKERFKYKHRNLRDTWDCSADFPDMAVMNAYRTPVADRNPTPFEWSPPDAEALRTFLSEHGVSLAELNPILQRLNGDDQSSAGMAQAHLDLFFGANNRFAHIESARIARVTQELTGQRVAVPAAKRKLKRSSLNQKFRVEIALPESVASASSSSAKPSTSVSSSSSSSSSSASAPLVPDDAASVANGAVPPSKRKPRAERTAGKAAQAKRNGKRSASGSDPDATEDEFVPAAAPRKRKAPVSAGAGSASTAGRKGRVSASAAAAAAAAAAARSEPEVVDLTAAEPPTGPSSTLPAPAATPAAGETDAPPEPVKKRAPKQPKAVNSNVKADPDAKGATKPKATRTPKATKAAANAQAKPVVNIDLSDLGLDELEALLGPAEALREPVPAGPKPKKVKREAGSTKKTKAKKT